MVATRSPLADEERSPLSTALDLVVTYFFVRPAVILLADRSAFQREHILGIDRGEAIPAGGVA